jgi:hypothetical protein
MRVNTDALNEWRRQRDESANLGPECADKQAALRAPAQVRSVRQ